MRLRRTVIWLAVAAALAAFGPTTVVRGVSAGHTHERVEGVPARDVALVLGAGVRPDGQPSAFLRGRLDVAADLHQQGTIKVILVSGDNSEQTYNEPIAMKRYLVNQRGIPAEHVVEDFAGFDTYDSCVRAKKIFGVDQLIVVSQGYHLPRAVATCRMVGVDAIGAGDQSARRFGGTWNYGAIREVPAAWKTIWDVVSRRTPTMGQQEDGVTRALGDR